MARSVAAHRKEVLEADDLLFSVEGDLNLSLSVAETRVGAPAGLVRAEEGEAEGLAKSPSTNGSALDLASVVTELAHELKNPMVTIKTFSQLLGERYDDPVFRTRFRELVSGDIERMDELLETLLEFSRLGRPAGQPISLLEQLRHVLEDVLPESKKAWVQDELIHIGPDTEVFMDQRHLRYALKNIVRTALFESKPRGEVDIHSEGEGVIVISYPQEGGRVVALSPYLDPNARTTEGDDPGMSLRLILARTLLEKNGGKIKMKYDDADVVRVRIELPLAQATVRNA